MAPARFHTPIDDCCGVCRGSATPRIDFGGQAVCVACLRRLNTDLANKRAILFAFHD